MSEEIALPYYSKYDDHYRVLYSKGIKYWSDGPEQSIAKNASRVISRILEAKPNPRGLKAIEFGCGEGFLVRQFVEMGIEYTGVDFSPHAIAKARERTADLGHRIDLRVMDALKLDEDIKQNKYDIVFDMACFHMFVVDNDSRVYLSNIKELMGPESVFVLTNQARDEQAYEGEIRSVEEYEKFFQVNLSGLRSWEAWDGQKWVPVELPRFACRSRSKRGYIREFEKAGFKISKVYEVGKENGMLDFILTL